MERVAMSEQGGMTEGVDGDERIEGEMEVEGRQGKEVFSCILSTNAVVSELLEVTRRLRAHGGWGPDFPLFSLSVDFVTRHRMTFWNQWMGCLWLCTYY